MKLHCEELIEKLKEEIPKYDKVIQGITHLQIKLKDGGMKQIVLVLERKQVIEPQTLLKKNQIYADVYVEIHDQVLADIASKDICINEAIEKKMFCVYGDDEIWKQQLTALKNVLPNLSFKTRKERLKKKEKNDGPSVNYSNLPQTDLSDIPNEFRQIVDHFESLRKKYNFNNPN